MEVRRHERAHRERVFHDRQRAAGVGTWRSLCIDQGLSDTEAVDAMTGMALAVTPAPRAEPAR